MPARVPCVPLPLRAVLGALLVVVATAGPAAADAAGPSDFRSEVIAIEPAVTGVEAEVRGGDSFLELRVEEGTEVVVDGYDAGEGSDPYLRFRPDGTVERNRSSRATYLNDDRLGRVEVPESAGPDTEPEWEVVSEDGTYAWHDHRIHWMADVDPPVGRGERVPGFDPWQVDIAVDGVPAQVRGTLTYEDAVSPLPWLGLAVLAAVALAWAGRRRAVTSASAALVVASVAAVAVGLSEHGATPDGGANPLLWALPVVALVAAGLALVPVLRGAAVVAVLAAVAALSGWALLRVGVLTKPVLPTEVPAGLDRASVAAALATAAAGAWLAVTSGALRLPDLEDD